MDSPKKILITSFQSLNKHSAGGMARLGYNVSMHLHKRGLLKAFVVSSKGKFEPSFPTVPVSKWSKYYLFILNKLNKLLNIPDYRFRLIQEQLYDIFCKAHITPDVSILFTTNAHMKRTFRKAKKMGIPIIYVPANPEENFIYDIVKKENELLGIRQPDPYTYQPRLKLYNDSIGYVDTVVCTYPTVYTSYRDSDRKYHVVQFNGHLKPGFQPYTYKEKPATGVLNVVYIATTVPLKGLQYLLEAWKQLMSGPEGDNLKLYVIGKIDSALDDYFKKHGFRKIRNVKYMGRVEDITTELESKDLCVVPSLTDAGPYVALEAAHYGIPVIITENCGSAELLNRYPAGCKVIPIRDVDAIKESILWAYNNREEARQLGKNAKQLLDNYQMEEFIIPITDYLEDRLNETTRI